MALQKFRQAFASRMRQLRDGRSYREFSRDIENKTGFYICFSNLREYELPDGPMPRKKTLEALVKYSGKPLSWFYETEEKTLSSGKFTEITNDFASLSPEEQKTIELLIKSIASAKKEQTAVLI